MGGQLVSYGQGCGLEQHVEDIQYLVFYYKNTAGFCFFSDPHYILAALLKSDSPKQDSKN